VQLLPTQSETFPEDGLAARSPTQPPALLLGGVVLLHCAVGSEVGADPLEG
jgi:hypothetical protein